MYLLCMLCESDCPIDCDCKEIVGAISSCWVLGIYVGGGEAAKKGGVAIDAN